MGNIVLLNTVSLKLKRVSGKLTKNFIGPFRIVEIIGIQSYQVRATSKLEITSCFSYFDTKEMEPV